MTPPRSALFAIALAALSCGSPADAPVAPAGTTHADLVTLFADWRAFAAPPVVDGVPDYSTAAMAAQHEALAAWQSRLASFDTTGWSIPERVDWHLVQAEMNGLDFDHRVLRPWQNNPAYYVQLWMAQSDTPDHEGPTPWGVIEAWKYDYPLSAEAAAELAARIAAIPAFLETAKTNLTGNQKDLWYMGVKAIDGQRADLERFGERVAGTSPDLDAAIVAAARASADLRDWLDAQYASRTGPSGVGRENYDWYLKNVHLSPYTWADEVRIMKEELARSYTALRFLENRSRNLAPLEPYASQAEWDRAMGSVAQDYVAFMEREGIVTTKDWFAPALAERIGRYNPEGPGSFFGQVDSRNPYAMRTHGNHWIDLARLEREPHPSPIRQVPQLYNIWDSRSEGLSTAWEEWMMQAGLFDDPPRAKELVQILIAQRAARALSGLYMHSNDFTLEQATKYAAEWTPRGWMSAESELVWFEQHLYLQQPGYGSSYLAGKAQLQELLLQVQHREGDAFTIKGFVDRMNASAIIPVSLLQWEMTGDDTALRRILVE